MKQIRLAALAIVLAIGGVASSFAYSNSLVNYKWYVKAAGPSGAYSLYNGGIQQEAPPTGCDLNEDFLCAKGFSTIIPPATVTDATSADLDAFRADQ